MHKLTKKLVVVSVSLLFSSFVWAGPIEDSQKLLAQGKYEEAVEILRTALKKNPQDNNLWKAYDEAVFKHLISERVSKVSWPRMKPEKFLELAILGKKIAFIDSRSPMETALWYPASKILDTYTIPLEQLPKRIAEINPEKYDYVVVACATGSRAAAIAYVLRVMGFNNVYFLRGGNEALGSLIDADIREAAKRLQQEGKLKELPAWMK